MKQLEAPLRRGGASARSNLRPPGHSGDIPDLWLARIERLERKLMSAECELISEGVDAFGVRALAETIRNEIATLRFSQPTAWIGGQRDEAPLVWTV